MGYNISMIDLNTDILQINRIGAATAKRLQSLGIAKARDLLFYFPSCYDDFSQITAMDELRAGQTANIVGRIELIQNKRSSRRRMNITEALVSDDTESVKVIWFNQAFIAKTLKAGDRVSLSGKVEEDFSGPVFMSPNYEKITKEGTIHTQGLVPNYHLTANITQKQLRFLIKSVIYLAEELDDWLPLKIKNELKLLSLAEAVKKIHFPENEENIKEAKKRLSFEELFLIQLQSQLIKNDLKASRAEVIVFKEEETKKFVDSLPFRLTDAQRKTAWEVLKDIGEQKPMSRLLEGDVGSGKTVVAAIAMLNAALNKRQSVLMAPTEILARQHFNSLGKLFAGWGIQVGLITRSMKLLNSEARIIKTELKNKKNKSHNSEFIIQNSDIIIGTHSLVQENIKFKDLALVIIDEQHRFGVEQRKALINKGGIGLVPHLLSMTATPIPRSLALAIYGDLDLSIINEMPKDRKKIITRIVPEESREKAYEFIRAAIKTGRQVFVICPLIDVSDKLGFKSVKEEFARLDKDIFPNLKIGLLHGKLKSAEKEKVMEEFLENKIKILVSTSVVEVGVDAPNASVMMIEGADHFGLAQLHQFRGRVGRSAFQSHCFLFTDSNAPQTLERLNSLVKYDSGFDLAKIDLQFRGPGEVYGTLQKGFPELKMASLFDYGLMKAAKEQAEKILEQDKNLSSYPALKEKIGEWERQAHLE